MASGENTAEMLDKWTNLKGKHKEKYRFKGNTKRNTDSKKYKLKEIQREIEIQLCRSDLPAVTSQRFATCGTSLESGNSKSIQIQMQIQIGTNSNSNTCDTTLAPPIMSSKIGAIDFCSQHLCNLMISRYMRTCQECPEIYPWTGRTGIANSLVDSLWDLSQSSAFVHPCELSATEEISSSEKKRRVHLVSQESIAIAIHSPQ